MTSARQFRITSMVILSVFPVSRIQIATLRMLDLNSDDIAPSHPVSTSAGM